MGAYQFAYSYCPNAKCGFKSATVKQDKCPSCGGWLTLGFTKA